MRFIYTKAFAVFVACLMAIAVFVLLQSAGWLFPIKNTLVQLPRPLAYVVSGVAKPVKNFFNTVYRLKKITQDNTNLENQVTQLQQQLVQFDQYRLENEALKKELGFVQANKGNLQPCTVLSRNPSGILDTLLLNCGTEVGVAEGQAVISQGHLIGKIIYATRGSSTVLLITNSKFTVDARLSQTGATGIVGGSFGTGLILDRLSQDDEAQSGWLVVTAGIDEKVPKNILIGQVGEVVSSRNDLFKKTTVVSPVDFDSIDFVFVDKP